MKMGLRWFGEGYDTVSLEKIRQVPGVSGVITTLYGAMPGEDWEKEEILALKQKVEDAGLEILGIESVNVHDDIKIGLPSRDRYIEAYIRTIRTLAECGIHLICYNFMPVFDWTRTDLAKLRPDGSTVLAYDQRAIDAMDPDRLFASMEESRGSCAARLGTGAAGAPERAVCPIQRCGREKAVGKPDLFSEGHHAHMRKIRGEDGHSPRRSRLERFRSAPDHDERRKSAAHDGGSGLPLQRRDTVHRLLGTNPDADLPGIVRMLKGKIFFAHVRNMEHTAPGCFEESAHSPATAPSICSPS